MRGGMLLPGDVGRGGPGGLRGGAGALLNARFGHAVHRAGGDWRRDASPALAAAEKAHFVNLNRLIMAHYAEMKPEDVKAKYFTPADDTHTSPAGGQAASPDQVGLATFFSAAAA